MGGVQTLGWCAVLNGLLVEEGIGVGGRMLLLVEDCFGGGQGGGCGWMRWGDGWLVPWRNADVKDGGR